MASSSYRPCNMPASKNAATATPLRMKKRKPHHASLVVRKAPEVEVAMARRYHAAHALGLTRPARFGCTADITARLPGLEAEAYVRDLIYVLCYGPRDRFLELAPPFWKAVRGNLDAVQSTARRRRSPSRRRSGPPRPRSGLRAEEVGITLVGWPRRARRRRTGSCSGYDILKSGSCGGRLRLLETAKKPDDISPVLSDLGYSRAPPRTP